MCYNQKSKQLIRLPDVIIMTGMTKSTIYAKIKHGEFPRPLKISYRHVAWDKCEVTHWIESLPVAQGSTLHDVTNRQFQERAGLRDISGSVEATASSPTSNMEASKDA